MFRQFAAIALAASTGTILPAEAAEIEITIAKMAFTPTEITAKIGDTINWTNKDFVAHTATARDKSFDIAIPAHGTGTLVVSTAGAVDYFCRFHPMMKGKILNGD